MRESVPAQLPSRTSGLLRSVPPIVTAIAALSFGLAGCTGKTKGQVILALQTDMSMPEDVTKVKIEVKADGVSRYDRVFIVDPNEKDNEKIPATLSIVAGEKENETIELKVVALRELPSGGDEPRTLNKTITTIPAERVAMLRVPMQWLCTDGGGDFIDDFGDGEYESACARKNGKETACVAGGCEDVHLDSSKLPDFAADAVFGGADDPGSSGKCFPTEECFDTGVDLVPDTDCVVSFEPESDDIINFAILSDTGGIGDCRSADGSPCYIGLDKSREFGWYELEDGEDPTGSGDPEPPLEAPSGRRFKLPQGVCDRLADGRAIGVRASTADDCEITKTPQYPTCGPWSSVGPKTEPPPPPGEDADGDGANAELDCDDDDNSVYPGALEACDEKDNDCDDVVDDDCVADLPFSHRVDFSALDGFTSTQSYAIYQAFDATRPLDLDQRTVTFVPSPDFTHYLVSTGELEWDSDIGELVPVTTGEDVSNCDDCYTSVGLDFAFTFFGVEYTTVFPSSNGYLTFGVGDETYSESIEEFLANAPRISAFWDDLDTTGTPGVIDDEVSYYGDESKLVVTYRNVQIFSSSGTSNTFQLVLFEDGTIKISYDGMDDLEESSLVGVTPGSLGGGVGCGSDTLTSCFGLCVDLETDSSHCGACGNVCPNMQCLAGTCAPEVECLVSSAPCPGLCLGSCQFTTAGVCEGQCMGTCSGACDAEDASGNCIGKCDGDCVGNCYLPTGGSCSDLCSGSCYVDDVADCVDPTEGMAGSCIFHLQMPPSGTDCYDSASVAGTASAVLSCNGDTCLCCKTATGQVCTTLATTPATACESAETVRNTFLTECLSDGQCGEGCPATEPSARATCNSDDIQYCVYSDMSVSRTCECTNDTFICN
ncbi:MAG TPA: MopE-related protein [Polyangiaceae bacterium]